MRWPAGIDCATCVLHCELGNLPVALQVRAHPSPVRWLVVLWSYDKTAHFAFPVVSGQFMHDQLCLITASAGQPGVVSPVRWPAGIDFATCVLRNNLAGQ